DRLHPSANAESAQQTGKQNLGFYEIYKRNLKPEWARSWHATEELLLAVRDLARENNADFATVLVPAAWEVYPQFWDDALLQVPGMRSLELDRDLPSAR